MGVNGNRAINNPYLALATLDIGAKMFSYLDASGNLKEMEYLKIGRMANPDLKWEKERSLQRGLGLRFPEQPHHRLFEGYVIKTKDMIMGRTLPPFTGFDEIATNLGEVQNKGVELTLNSQNMAMKKLRVEHQFQLCLHE